MTLFIFVGVSKKKGQKKLVFTELYCINPYDKNSRKSFLLCMIVVTHLGFVLAKFKDVVTILKQV